MLNGAQIKELFQRHSDLLDEVEDSLRTAKQTHYADQSTVLADFKKLRTDIAGLGDGTIEPATLTDMKVILDKVQFFYSGINLKDDRNYERGKSFAFFAQALEIPGWQTTSSYSFYTDNKDLPARFKPRPL